ncbi:MAG: hypothetical protein HC853_08310, partial [Anaerolineae bacterium]|nr:hypothetical protein [Anaerolineae bacterium]
MQYIFIFIILNLIFLGGCTTEKSISAEPTKSAEITSDSAKGYTEIAVKFIKQARETGDFSLNSKAEAAVEKALKVDATDVTARKLKASL